MAGVLEQARPGYLEVGGQVPPYSVLQQAHHEYGETRHHERNLMEALGRKRGLELEGL